MGRLAGRGSVNFGKTSVKVLSYPPHALERVMTTPSAWKVNTLQGADEAVVTWEVGRKKPNTVILSVWRFCEGACEHALRP